LPFAYYQVLMRKLGGKYEKNKKPWSPCFREDGHLITGANPASGEELGHALVKALSGHLNEKKT
jgi:putative intracellular protease/amidase